MGRKNKPAKKGGISLAKKKNIKGGKMASGKKTKGKSVLLARKKLQTAVRKKLQRRNLANSSGAVNGEVNVEDILDMIDEQDLSHLKGQEFKDRQHLVSTGSKAHERGLVKGSKRRLEDDEENLENLYEHKLLKTEESEKHYRMLLPLKTSKGLQLQVTEDVTLPDEDVGQGEGEKFRAEEPASEENSHLVGATVSFGKLIAERRASLLQYRLRIGTLASGFLEDPQNKMKNLDSLLMIMDGNDPGVSIIVPKLCAMSLLVCFKDVLPSYAIKHTAGDGVKLKKDTLHLQTYESQLLSKYRMYLKKLENLISKYCPRRRTQQVFSSSETQLGIVAFQCMCDMLLSHPYFNMATNLTNFLIPYLNNWNSEIRSLIYDCVTSIFRNDKRGEISYEVVRRINDLVKLKLGKKGNKTVREEVLNVLLSLRIKEVNLLKEKEEESVSRKKMTFEKRRMLSKNQRKKAKELVQLEMELLEASAEENKERKSHFLTEITKLVFTIYFRAMKNENNSKILSCVLEGLSKFAHVINIDYFDDILKVLEGLLQGGHLQQKQALFCISTILAILDGQGAALTLDPTSFHKHLYKILSELNSGSRNSEVSIALRCVKLGFGKRKAPGVRVMAFAKRLATLALQVPQHEAAAILAQLKELIKLHPSVSVLLDCDDGGSCGLYLPELNDPDHACANASSMWEITSLMEHYHPWVRQFAKSFVLQNAKVPLELLNRTPEAICDGLNPWICLEFQPDLPEPDAAPRVRKQKGRYHFTPKTGLIRSLCQEEGTRQLIADEAETLISYR